VGIPYEHFFTCKITLPNNSKWGFLLLLFNRIADFPVENLLNYYSHYCKAGYLFLLLMLIYICKKQKAYSFYMINAVSPEKSISLINI
jgi:hypothetical protein